MNIVFFAHPAFLGHQSMPRFARQLAAGMRSRGHRVEIWTPQAVLVRLAGWKPLQKWAGYFDQYLLFPRQVRQRLRQCPPDTLFVFTDHALGPWVPLVAPRPHVIYCHDFLAQRSALGEIPENVVSWSGRRYQAFIRRGYSQGRNFISVSERTKQDLSRFLPAPPAHSVVVYNGLNQDFTPMDAPAVRRQLSRQWRLPLEAGYLLHVGGNHFYKNRIGVIELYTAWRATGSGALPLLLLGEAPSQQVLAGREKSPFRQDIHFLPNPADEVVRMAYAGASVFLFPSLAEGFGWPIAEAMASGCPVITTNEAPMTEVAGGAGFLLPRRPASAAGAAVWAREAAPTIEQVLQLPAAARHLVREAGLRNAARFSASQMLDRTEVLYQTILETSGR